MVVGKVLESYIYSLAVAVWQPAPAADATDSIDRYASDRSEFFFSLFAYANTISLVGIVAV